MYKVASEIYNKNLFGVAFNIDTANIGIVIYQEKIVIKDLGRKEWI